MKRLAIVASVVYLWIVSSASAQSTSTTEVAPVSQAAPAKFKVKAGSVATPECGLQPTTVLLAGRFKITFMSPRSCISSIQAEQQKISFSSTKTQMAITVRVAADFALPSDAELQQRFQEIYKGAKIQPATEAISSAGTGRSCDIQRVIKNVNVMITRHAYIPFSGGCLEIVFTTDADSFRAQRFVFTWLMNSLKIEPRSASE